jgi:hypothetical protein
MVNGSVHLLKMPPILNPLNPEQTFNSEPPATKDNKAIDAKGNATATVRSSQE